MLQPRDQKLYLHWLKFPKYRSKRWQEHDDCFRAIYNISRYDVGAQKHDHSWGGGGCGRGGAEYKLLWQVKLDSRVKTLTARSVAILASRAICYPNPGQRGVSSLVVVLCTGSAQLCLVLGFGVFSHFKLHSLRFYLHLALLQARHCMISEQPESGLFMDWDRYGKESLSLLTFCMVGRRISNISMQQTTRAWGEAPDIFWAVYYICQKIFVLFGQHLLWYWSIRRFQCTGCTLDWLVKKEEMNPAFYTK